MSYYKKYDESLLDRVLFISEDMRSNLVNSDLFEEYQSKVADYSTVVVDIGCGNGHLVNALAKDNQQTLFVGIDKKQERLIRCREKETKRNLNNVFWICGDAFIVLDNFFSDNCLDHAYMLFPDPWPKRRHHKNRLFTDKFVDVFWSKLKPAGLFTFLTDYEDYYKQALTIATQNKKFKKITDNRLLDFNKTLFALKWKQENRTFYSIELEK